MKLNTLLTSMRRDSASKADPDTLAVMLNARQQLEDSDLLKTALGRGEKMANFVLLDTDNNEFSSQEALKKGPLLLCWYRGIW